MNGDQSGGATDDSAAAPDETGTSPLKIGPEDVVSVLAAGLIGLVNYLGLKDAEVANVLRNEPIAPSIVSLIAAVGFVLAASSVFLSGDISRKRGFQVIPITMFLVALVTALTTVPLAQYDLGAPLYWIVIVALAGSAVLIARMIRRREPGDNPNTNLSIRAVALVLALSLTVIAGYGALRIEERSQVRASYPKTGLTSVTVAPNSTVTATGDATRLPIGGTLEVEMYGIPRPGWDTHILCASKDTVAYAPPCVEASCFYVLDESFESKCRPLGYMRAQPDQNGAAHAEISVTMPLIDFQRVEVIERVCQPTPAPSPLTHKTSCAANDGVKTDPPKQAFAGISFPDP